MFLLFTGIILENRRFAFSDACEKQVTDEGIFQRKSRKTKTTSGWTLSPHRTDSGMKSEPHPRLLGRRATIVHCHSYLVHYGSYRSALQLPKVPAVGHLNTGDGLLATCSSSLRKEANTRRHTDARRGVAVFTHSKVGLPCAPRPGQLRQAAATTTVLSPHGEGTAKIVLPFPVWKKANAS